MGDYLRQFSIVTAGIIVTFIGNDMITEYARQKEVKATMHLVIDELKQSREQLKGVHKLMDADRHMAQLIVQSGFNKEAIPEDTLVQYYRFFGNLTSFSYTTDALEVLKGSSLMQYISEKKLLQNIINAYYQLSNAKEDITHYYEIKSDAINEVVQELSVEELTQIAEKRINMSDSFFSRPRWRSFCLIVPDFLNWDSFVELDGLLKQQIETLEERYK